MNYRIVCIYSPLAVYCCILNIGGYCVCLSGGLFNCHQKNDSVNIQDTTQNTPLYAVLICIFEKGPGFCHFLDWAY